MRYQKLSRVARMQFNLLDTAPAVANRWNLSTFPQGFAVDVGQTPWLAVWDDGKRIF
jgi:hypothetical protein